MLLWSTEMSTKENSLQGNKDDAFAAGKLAKLFKVKLQAKLKKKKQPPARSPVTWLHQHNAHLS